jgi:predicted nucleotide-binding protein (sugar kinase/HSP70/actin superfamily)
MKIGIPRAMMFYRYYPLWSTFLHELRIEVIISPPTSKKLVDRGIIHAPEDTCLPVKVAMGHAEWFKDKVDFVFIPRLVHISPRYATCPKFLGLPDIIRADVHDLPPVLDPTFDAKKESFRRTFMKLGLHFTKNPLRIRKAYKLALAKQKRFQEAIGKGMDISHAMGFEENKELKNYVEPSMTIGVVGHPYNLYDRYINVNLFRKLEAMGARVITPEMLPRSAIEKALNTLDRPPYWELEREIVGAALYFLNGNADGVIHIISFECGPDSLLQAVLEFENQNLCGIPYVPLVLDEHTGEAGLVTRLEAFIDMIVRKALKSEHSLISRNAALKND